MDVDALAKALLEPQILITRVVVGLVAGMIGKKIFYRGRKRGGGGTFGSLVTTLVTGMIGAALGVGVGLFVGVPGADHIAGMVLLAIVGTLILMFVSSFFNK